MRATDLHGAILMLAVFCGVAADAAPLNPQMARPAPNPSAAEKRCSWHETVNGVPKNGMCCASPDTSLGADCICETTHVGPSGVVDARHGEDTHHGVVVPYPTPNPASRIRSGAAAPLHP